MARILLAVVFLFSAFTTWALPNGKSSGNAQNIACTITPPASPTNAVNIDFTVTFGASVTGFTTADLSINSTAGGTATPSILGSGSVYTVRITGVTGTGNVSLSVNADAATDGTDTSVPAGPSMIAFDNVIPTVTIDKKAGQADPTNASPILYTVVFSKPINATTFTTSDINLTSSTTGGTLTPTITEVGPMDGTTYEVSVAITGSPATGNVIASINASAVQDPAGNNNSASTSGDNSVFYDITPPSVTVNKKSGQADPTSAGPILFTVVFGKPINGTSFTNADVNMGASTTGGTLTPTVTEVAPMNSTTYEISVAITGSPVSGDIIASINASAVQDALGNNNTASSSTDNIVALTLSAPSLTTPTATAIDVNVADLGGTITADGGSPVTERGTVWKTTAGVTIADNKLAEGGTSVATFSHTRSSLPAGTKIYYRAYATNAIGTSFTSETFFYTLSVVPDNQPASVTAAAVSPTQINLTFSSAASTGSNTSGYVILRRPGTDPDVTSVQDGVAPASLVLGTSTLVANITNTATTTYNDGTPALTPGTKYNYAVVPYHWDGTNPGTINYKTGGGFTTDNATTFNSASDIILNGGTTNQILYESKTANPITANNGSVVTLGQLQLRDGGASNDADSEKTTLATLTIQLTNFASVKRIALYDGGNVLAGTEQPVTGATVSFTIPAGDIEANDNNTDDFYVLASFNPGVTDHQVIQLTVTGATVSTSGSGLGAANAGGATTGTSTNIIDVVAEKLVFLSNPPNTPINTAFSLTVRALDHPNNNLDLDATNQVSLSKSGGNGAATLLTTPASATPNLVAGVFTWSNLKLDYSGNYTLAVAENSLTDAAGSVTITSNGVNVTPASPVTVCYNSSFQTLSTITVTESDPSDFAMGAGQIFSLVLPAGFIFDTSLTPTPVLTGTGISSPVAASYVGNNIVRLGYTITGTSNINSVAISGLKVKYSGSSPGGGNIIRFGGTAVQAGNSESDNKNHGTLTANAGSAPVGFTFTVQATPGNLPISPTETSFNVNDPPVMLLGNPSGGTFSGNGVVLSASNGYTFSPSVVGAGTYTITYTYTEVGGQQCTFNVSKTFAVSTSIIQNLLLQYCSDASPSTGLNVNQVDIDNYFGPGYTFVDFVYWNPVSLTQTAIPAPNTTFDPQSSLYTPSYNFAWSLPRGVYIGYRANHPTYGTSTAWQFVRVPLAPVVTFTIPKNSFCADEPFVLLTGSPANSTNTSNDFFTSSIGSGVPTPSPTTNPWIFTPANVGATSTPVSLNITYTYKDPGTGCQVTSLPQAVNVYPRPSQVPSADIVSGTSLNTCVNGAAVNFTTDNTTWPTTTYKWYADNSLTTLLSTSKKNFSPSVPPATSPQLDTSTPGTTNFYVTRTINGCESQPLTLNATVDPQAVADAGNDFTICAGNELLLSSLSASISGAATSAKWSAVGTSPGQFQDATNAVNINFGSGGAVKYVPSASDINAGSVRLILTSNDPSGPCGPAVDDVTIFINKVATVNAGSNSTVCSGQPVVLNGSISGGVTTGTWSRVGTGGGFGDGNTPTITDQLTYYNPTASELSLGAIITFTIASDDPDGPGPCPIVSQNVAITINKRALVDAGTTNPVCDGTPVQLNGSIPATISSASSVTWSGGLGSFSPNANALNATYNPDPTEVGTTVPLTLTSNDPDGTGPLGPCPVETDNVDAIINKIPQAPNATQPDPYCVQQSIGNLTAVGANLKWYDNSALGAPNLKGVGTSFATGLLADAEKIKDFYVTETDKGCESTSTKVTVTVNPLPVPAFTKTNFCLGDNMQFTDASTVPGSTRSISAWEWVFADGDKLDEGSGAVALGTHAGRTSGTYQNPAHTYASIGNFTVLLRAKSSDGCYNTTSANVVVGPVPKADFSFKDVCVQKDPFTSFTYTGTIPGQLTGYSWDFGDPSSTSNTSVANAPTHTFSGVNTYPVKLTVTTALGCSDITTKNVSILPYVSDFTNRYQESFENANHGWVAAGFRRDATTSELVNEYSWNLTTPSGTEIKSASLGTKAWITQNSATTTYYNNERSVLNGPCINVSLLPRPVLSFDFMNSTDAGGDGVFVQVSDDGGQTWSILGNLSSGLDWYNRGGILGLSDINGLGQTVGQIGWSGKTAQWSTAKFSLDSYRNRDKLRVRFVFGSNSDNTQNEKFEGFAMDNFILESRNRVVLVENFTNTLAPNSTLNDQLFKNFPTVAANSSDLVKIEYHTSFPGTDAFNIQNASDPNARAAFYGISAAPRAYIDGYNDNQNGGNFTGSSAWTANYYDTRSLVSSPVNITVTNPTGGTDGKISFSVNVIATDAAIKANELSLYIAVIEKQVGTQAYVLRKLLPTAAGNKLPAMAKGATFSVNETWTIDKSNVADPNQLAIIAFVQADQADNTGVKRIMQASFNGTMPSINFTTGLNENIFTGTVTYPNPADHELTIQLPQAINQVMPVQLADQLGKVVYTSTFKAGEKSKTINTRDLAAGLYILQLETEGKTARTKVIVAH